MPGVFGYPLLGYLEHEVLGHRTELCEASMAALSRLRGPGTCRCLHIGGAWFLSLPRGGLIFALPYFCFGLAIASVWSAVCVVAVRGIKGRSGVFSGNAPRPETRRCRNPRPLQRACGVGSKYCQAGADDCGDGAGRE